MLLEEFLKPLGLTQREVAEAIGVPYQRVNEIVNRRRGVTPSTALRLSQYFGTSSGFWMNGQMRWDLYQAQQTDGDQVRRIRRHPDASRTEASASAYVWSDDLRGEERVVTVNEPDPEIWSN